MGKKGGNWSAAPIFGRWCQSEQSDGGWQGGEEAEMESISVTSPGADSIAMTGSRIDSGYCWPKLVSHEGKAAEISFARR
jgi:hypothetical protein